MMKHVFAGILLSTLFVSVDTNASYYQSMQKRLRLFGEKIESVDNVPLVDKLTNLLPFAMVAACFKECPGQTMMVLTGLFVYVLFANDKFRSTLRKYNPFKGGKRSTKNELQFDDSLFVFEGDDEGYGSEEEFIAEELLLGEEEFVNEEALELSNEEFVAQELLLDAEDLLIEDEYDALNEEEIRHYFSPKFL